MFAANALILEKFSITYINLSSLLSIANFQSRKPLWACTHLFYLDTLQRHWPSFKDFADSTFILHKKGHISGYAPKTAQLPGTGERIQIVNIVQCGNDRKQSGRWVPCCVSDGHWLRKFFHAFPLFQQSPVDAAKVRGCRTSMDEKSCTSSGCYEST